MRAATGEAARVGALAAGAAGLTALALLVAYQSSPAIPLAGLAGAIVAVLAVTRPLVVLLLALAVIPLETVTLPLGGAGVSATEALIALASIGWAVGRLFEGRLPVARTALNGPIAIALICVVAGLAVAEKTFPVVRILLMWSLFALAFQMIVDDGRRETVRRILALLVASGTAVGLIALVRSGGRAPELSAGGDVAMGRATGAFSDPNILATFLVMALPAALALALGSRPAMRPLATGAFVVIFAALALSLSRGGLIAAGGALGVMLAWRPFRRVAVVSALVLVALTVVNANPLVGTQQVDTVLDRLVSVERASQNKYDQRTEIYSVTPEIITDHPLLGVGANQFPEVAPSYGLIDPYTGFTFEHPHNLVLTTFVELGIAGLLALLWAGVILARLLWRAAARTSPDRGLAVAVAAAFVALFVQGLVDYTLRSNVLAALTAVLAACAVVLSRPPRETAT